MLISPFRYLPRRDIALLCILTKVYLNEIRLPALIRTAFGYNYEIEKNGLNK